MIAQFVYVGAQVGVASFVIRFAEFTSPGMPDKVAANSLKLHLLSLHDRKIRRIGGDEVCKRRAAAGYIRL